MKIRRVVTGQTGSGKSVFVSDEQLEGPNLAMLPGYEFHRMWGSDAEPALPADGKPLAHPGYFPPHDGYRFGFFTLPPNSVRRDADLDVGSALAEMQQKLPGLAEVMEPDHPGMHTTDTVDFDVIVSGEVWLELDDGKELLLKAGDCVVQNGTRHAWRNRSSQPCVIAVCLLGAHRAR
jgi:mannose-6-phosphate isomerase-like protein (cupin superfamily)